MSRRTRKQLVGKLEDVERTLREEEMRELRSELRWQWRTQLEDRQLLAA